jgi:hypothetical protein
MKNYKQLSKPYEPDEWEEDSEWLAQRISFLWCMRDYYPRYYVQNGFADEKNEFNLTYGTDNKIIGRAHEIFYGEFRVNTDNRYKFNQQTIYQLARRFIELCKMKDSDMELFLTKKHYIEYEFLQEMMYKGTEVYDAYCELTR